MIKFNHAVFFLVKVAIGVGIQSAGSFDLDLLINRYLGLAQLYVKNVPDITESEIVRNVDKDLSASAAINFNNYGKPSDTSSLSYYFRFIAYAILAIVIMGITSIMR